MTTSARVIKWLIVSEVEMEWWGAMKPGAVLFRGDGYKEIEFVNGEARGMTPHLPRCSAQIYQILQPDFG